MNIAALLFVLAAATVDLDVVTVPLSNPVRLVLAPGARGEVQTRRHRHESATSKSISIAAPSTLGPALNTYVVWAITPEGILDNLGELEVKGAKGQLTATTRLDAVRRADHRGTALHGRPAELSCCLIAVRALKPILDEERCRSKSAPTITRS